ncbi:MAG: DUF1579 domain-containing protein [Bryobacter sp.]|nr:DUF1579 domain-containing protein [Bryobacter sp.]
MRGIVCLVCALASAVVLLAVDPKLPGAPKAPELQLLDSLVGEWNYTGENKLSGAKYTSSTECGWDRAGQFLLCDEQGKTGNNPVSYARIFGYDRRTKTYILSMVDTDGSAFIMTGAYAAGKWTWSREGSWQHRPARFQLERVEDTAAGTATFAWKVSVGGGPWVVFSEGKGTRRK